MKRSVIKALCYADVFNFPLTKEEIYQWLDNKITPSLLNRELTKHQIKSSRGLYHLPGRSNLVNRRLSLIKPSQEKTKYTKSVVNWLKLIPSIKAVYITGALTMENSDYDDDIDLMIITQSGRLWTTRALVNGILDLLNLRRKPSSENLSNKLCLNLWLDESSLKIKSPSRSLYLAHEIVQAKLIWQRDNINDQFLYQNRWINKYLPNSRLPIETKRNTALTKPNLIEKIFYKIQTNIMDSKKTSEKTAASYAFFHPRNTNQIVLKKYKTRLKKYLFK